MAVFTYPTNRELTEIQADKVARLTTARLGMEFLPVEQCGAAQVEWEQKDISPGLQQIRGLDGAPTHVRNTGSKVYSYDPGVFGEFMTIDETELTKRGAFIGANIPIPVDDLVLSRQDRLLGRELDMIEFLIWSLLINGQFSVVKPNGNGGSTVAWSDSFPVQTYTPLVPWSTLATAAPLLDFMNMQQLMVGHSLDFGSSASVVMNTQTLNKLFRNQNANDLAGLKSQYGATVLNSLVQVNQILMGRNLPQIRVYDEGYFDDNGTFHKYIPDGKLALIGRRTTGEKIGAYKKTFNAVKFQALQAIGDPKATGFGSYSFVKDFSRAINGEIQVPPRIEIHQGHNGGPVLYFGNAVVTATVYTP